MKGTIRTILVLLPALLAAAAFAREDHRPYRDMSLPECAECHKDSKVHLTHGGGWLREHRVVSDGAGTNCADCHDEGYCLDCHQGGALTASIAQGQWKRDVEPPDHRSDWISIHPIQANADPQQCQRCHDRRDCQNCHTSIQRGAMTVKSHVRVGNSLDYVAGFPEPHATEARRELSSCQSCHPDGNVCLPCHSSKAGLGINPHPKDFKAGRIQNRSNNRSCRVCHNF